MAEASAATPIHVVPVVLYRSGGACLRHARPNHICRPLYVSSSAVSLPKRLHTFWVMGRLWTKPSPKRMVHSRGDVPCARPVVSWHSSEVSTPSVYARCVLADVLLVAGGEQRDASAHCRFCGYLPQCFLLRARQS